METIANLIFEYNGKKYPLDFSFGNDYPTSAAYYMFEIGNYSCDCNRAIFLRERYGEAIPEMDCGNKIRLIKIEVINGTEEE